MAPFAGIELFNVRKPPVTWRDYFVATFGNITDEAIMEYIENQDKTAILRSAEGRAFIQLQLNPNPPAKSRW